MVGNPIIFLSSLHFSICLPVKASSFTYFRIVSSFVAWISICTFSVTRIRLLYLSVPPFSSGSLWWQCISLGVNLFPVTKHLPY